MTSPTGLDLGCEGRKIIARYLPGDPAVAPTRDALQALLVQQKWHNAALDEMAARWNLNIAWGGDFDDEDFTDDLDVPMLMTTAHDRLREHGYTVWNWNTGGDAYAGWVALSRDDEAMLALCSLLGVEVRPGSDPF